LAQYKPASGLPRGPSAWCSPLARHHRRAGGGTLRATMRLASRLLSAAGAQRVPAAAVAAASSSAGACRVQARCPTFAVQRRSCAAAATTTTAASGTRLGQYLEACGANWGDVAEIHEVVAVEDGQSFAWQVDLPPERLAALRPGESLESRPFELLSRGGGVIRARFQLFPKGDADAKDKSSCSLWLCTDSREPVPVELRLGGIERPGGSSDFCRLEDVLKSGALEVGVRLAPDAGKAMTSAGSPAVQQSLQLTGLQLAEWRLFDAAELFRAGALVSSPPFRFHHVLLGDMYLELQPGAPHPEHCALFFRCRVPTMRLRVNLEVGEGSFSKSFEAVGKSTPDADLKNGRCLQVNFEAPSVLDADGSLVVRAALEEVVTLPAALRDMIPRLDERASWPKRL